MRQVFVNANYDFMGIRKIFMPISAITSVIALLFIVFRGFNLAIDFTGGTLIEVSYPAAVELATVREALVTGGFNDAQVQHFGTAADVLIRVPPREGSDTSEISTHVLSALQSTSGGAGVTTRRVEFVGPQVGGELANDGGLALLFSLIGVLIYVALRFEKRFAVGAVVATMHDVILTAGLFSIFQWNFDLSVVAGLLAVVGYSLNDTIVVYDRIRENFRKMRKGTTLEIVNVSINQTLSRTIMTSFTTFLVMVLLLIFGGEAVRSFSLALIVGIVVGTYSSIYVGSAMAVALGVSRADLLPVEKEGAQLDSRP